MKKLTTVAFYANMFFVGHGFTAFLLLDRSIWFPAANLFAAVFLYVTNRPYIWPYPKEDT
jgi:hypothetical protein